MQTGLSKKSKICVVSCFPALDNEFYSRASDLYPLLLGSQTICIGALCASPSTFQKHHLLLLLLRKLKAFTLLLRDWEWHGASVIHRCSQTPSAYYIYGVYEIGIMKLCSTRQNDRKLRHHFQTAMSCGSGFCQLGFSSVLRRPDELLVAK